MSKRAVPTIALLLAGLSYWQLVCALAGTDEPWDAPSYWRLWYPASLALSAVAGWWARERGWRAGATLTFAQWPVMWINTGTGPLWAAGLLMLFALSVPAITVSALAGARASRSRAAS